MTKISKKIRLEIDALRWFIPSALSKAAITLEDEAAFAAWSSRGVQLPETPGTEALKWAKTYREYSITMWREDVTDGLITWDELLDDMPLPTQTYVKRSLAIV